MKCPCAQPAKWRMHTYDAEVGGQLADEYLCPRCVLTAMSVLAYTLDRRIVLLHPLEEIHHVQFPALVTEKEVKDQHPYRCTCEQCSAPINRT